MSDAAEAWGYSGVAPLPADDDFGRGGAHSRARPRLAKPFDTDALPGAADGVLRGETAAV